MIVYILLRYVNEFYDESDNMEAVHDLISFNANTDLTNILRSYLQKGVISH